MYWSKIFRRMVLYLVLWLGVLGVSENVYAAKYHLPKETVVVKNEKQMISRMISGMRKHETFFSFYYPGIGRKFKKYQRQSPSYRDFLRKLSEKDGYTTGIVSGFCITICGEEKQYLTFQLGYLTTKRQEKKIDKKVRKIVKKLGRGSKAVRAKRAHDYLIRHMQYDGRYYNPYYAFSKGRGNCMCYALAYQRILQEMKIPCQYIRGKNHAWNKVKLGTRWYKVDVTADDRRGR